MVTDRPPTPIYVLNSRVDTGGYQLHGNEHTGLLPTSQQGQGGWRSRAQGGRLTDVGRTSRRRFKASGSTRVSATPGFESELNACFDDDDDETLTPYAVVLMAEEQGLTVILMSLESHLYYYLVYDAIDGSLSMFQALPHAYRGVSMAKPIVPKRTAGDSSDYKLLLLKREDVSCPHQHEDLSWPHEHDFWVAYPAPDSTSLSKFKRMHFPAGEIPQAFTVDVAFSFQAGKDFWGFWGDLQYGVAYCNLQTMDDFGFIKLPREVKVDEEMDGPRSLIRKTRTMGCVGDSVWFVCIDATSHYTNDVVSIWKMELPGGKRKEGQWEIVEQVPAKVLWELSSFKEAGLPAAPIRYPILMAGGDLCFVLADQSRFPRRERPLVDHFCCFDMFSKKLLWHALVHNYQITDSVIMYPSSGFLQKKLCSRNSSFAEDSCGDTK